MDPAQDVDPMQTDAATWADIFPSIPRPVAPLGDSGLLEGAQTSVSLIQSPQRAPPHSTPPVASSSGTSIVDQARGYLRHRDIARESAHYCVWFNDSFWLIEEEDAPFKYRNMYNAEEIRLKSLESGSTTQLAFPYSPHEIRVVTSDLTNSPAFNPQDSQGNPFPSRAVKVNPEAPFLTPPAPRFWVLNDVFKTYWADPDNFGSNYSRKPSNA